MFLPTTNTLLTMSREERAKFFSSQEAADVFGPYPDELAAFAANPHAAICQLSDEKRAVVDKLCALVQDALNDAPKHEPVHTNRRRSRRQLARAFSGPGRRSAIGVHVEILGPRSARYWTREAWTNNLREIRLVESLGISAATAYYGISRGLTDEAIAEICALAKTNNEDPCVVMQARTELPARPITFTVLPPNHDEW